MYLCGKVLFYLVLFLPVKMQLPEILCSSGSGPVELLLFLPLARLR